MVWSRMGVGWPRRPGKWEDDLARAYPALRTVNGIGPMGLRVLMDEEPAAVRRAIDEDLRSLEAWQVARLSELIEGGADVEALARIRTVMRNEYELRRRENEAHLEWVRREVDTGSFFYGLYRLARSVSRRLAGFKNR